MRSRRAAVVLLSALLVGTVLGVALVIAEDAERLPTGQCTPRPDGAEWIDLLDASHVDHWQNVTDKKNGVFEISDGVFHVIGQKPTRYIAYLDEAFGDFALHVEFKTSKDANSGVFFRSDPANPVQGGMEVQVLDDCGQAPSKNSTGALYDVATPMFNMSLPTGEWNSCDITCRGPQVTVVMNDWKALDLDLSKLTMPVGKFDTPLAQLPRKGHVILQNHGNDVWFRNVLVRKL